MSNQDLCVTVTDTLIGQFRSCLYVVKNAMLSILLKTPFHCNCQ